MDTMANSEGPDGMPHNAAFHQGLHFFAEVKTIVSDLNIY